MSPADWIDVLTVPPRPLPADIDDAVRYLSDALDVPVYERWTPASLLRKYGCMQDARAAEPEVFALLLAGGPVVQFWDAGRVLTVPAGRAPRSEVVVERLLRVLRVRFRCVRPRAPQRDPEPVAGPAPHTCARAQASLDDEPWLAGAGHLVNRDAASNTLGSFDDASAIRLFLRDRAGGSVHTRRGYIAEIRRLVRWCEANDIAGPLSGLSREHLVSYREALSTMGARTARASHVLGERSQQRALAVVRSVLSYLWRTGYLTANPGAGLGDAAAAREKFAPDRILPAGAVRACDDWLRARLNADGQPLAVTRRAAIVATYRFTGIRLDELAWHDGYPRLATSDEGWTLQVRGKGHRERAVPVPGPCVILLQRYRSACGLPPDPAPRENLPLIRGQRRDALGPSGLYREVRVAFAEMAAAVPPAEVATRLALQEASPHWLRHLVGKTLVVDAHVPLPVAQVLLGHRSVATTAGYARADASELRNVMQRCFTLTPGPG
ncbi:tyrosine-type recombinase/integrase [Paraburkholderia phenoliruptrix]|uniref:tyrosine-type recombinase/integrase n=1 Tax=Paraburkholderia phenoliruptrix TaxID=252970 RepID=UPI003D986FD2